MHLLASGKALYICGGYLHTWAQHPPVADSASLQLNGYSLGACSASMWSHLRLDFLDICCGDQQREAENHIPRCRGAAIRKIHFHVLFVGA
jgi:hypothetical protein